MNDPTYVRAEIDANPVWALAFFLSECDNDNAPIGWGRYITMARLLRDRYTLTEKEISSAPSGGQ
jgi:hypothetical protein